MIGRFYMNLQVNNGWEDCNGQDQHEPFKVAAGEKTREVQDQNRNRDDVEQREQHLDSPVIFVIDRLTGNYDDKRRKSLANEAH